MKILKFILITAAFLTPSVAISESIQNYFTTNDYQCEYGTYFAEWSVTGDTNSDVVSIQQFLRKDYWNRSRFENLTWRFPAVDLSRDVEASGLFQKMLHVKYKFSGMLSQSPRVTALDLYGNPLDGCLITLKPALDPSQRFEALISALNITEPSASDGMLVDDLLVHLPPSAMLPTLSQKSTELEVQNANRRFWDRYKTTVLFRAGNVEDINVISETAKFWINGTKNPNDSAIRSFNEFHPKLIVEAQRLRAKAIRQQGQDPSRLAVVEPETLCARIDAVETAKFATFLWDEYLELATGLPLENWSEILAEEFLASSATCKNTHTFRHNISQRWPDIQARIAAFNEILVERDRIAGIDITLESIVAENWLSIDKERLRRWRRSGIYEDDVTDIISPALDMQKQIAIEQLPGALGKKARTQTIELGDYTSWCDQRRHKMGYMYFNYLQETIFEACHVELAVLLREQALEAIETHKVELLGVPQNINTLIATGGYSFENVIPFQKIRHPAFKSAVADINAALTTAQHEMELRYQTALTAAMESISTAFANAEPMGESARAANELCAPFALFGSPQRLRPISDLCQNLRDDLRLRQREAELRQQEVKCDLIWSNMVSPEGIQRGYLIVPHFFTKPKPINIREIVCDLARTGVNVWITEDRSWFSSTFRLHRNVNIQTQSLEISIRLNEPEAISMEWTVDDLILPSVKFRPAETVTNEEIIGCFLYPEICYLP